VILPQVRFVGKGFAIAERACFVKNEVTNHLVSAVRLPREHNPYSRSTEFCLRSKSPFALAGQRMAAATLNGMKKIAILHERKPAAHSQITAVVATNSKRFRQVVCQKLGSQGRVKVVAALENGLAALRETIQRLPELVLLDLLMPDLTGLEAAKLIHARVPATSVVLMSRAEIDEVERRCDESGANAFILERDLLDRIDMDIKERGVERRILRRTRFDRAPRRARQCSKKR